MTRIEGVLFCDGCGAEITWSPVVVRATSASTQYRTGYYCCDDCSQGRPCRCGERMEFGDELRERGKISLPF